MSAWKIDVFPYDIRYDIPRIYEELRNPLELERAQRFLAVIESERADDVSANINARDNVTEGKSDDNGH